VIILDTSFLIDLAKDERLAGALPEDEVPVTTVITYYEIMAGLKRFRSKKEMAFFRRFFAETDILEMTLPAADIASSLGARMAGTGRPANAFDILITGITLAHHGKGIITADADFSEIAKFADINVIGYSPP